MAIRKTDTLQIHKYRQRSVPERRYFLVSNGRYRGADPVHFVGLKNVRICRMASFKQSVTPGWSPTCLCGVLNSMLPAQAVCLPAVDGHLVFFKMKYHRKKRICRVSTVGLYE